MFVFETEISIEGIMFDCDIEYDLEKDHHTEGDIVTEEWENVVIKTVTIFVNEKPTDISFLLCDEDFEQEIINIVEEEETEDGE